MSADTAKTMAALWRACREEVRVLDACIAQLERAVARAMLHPPPAESAPAWSDLLAAERTALEACRKRGALIAALLEGPGR